MGVLDLNGSRTLFFMRHAFIPMRSTPQERACPPAGAMMIFLAEVT